LSAVGLSEGAGSVGLNSVFTYLDSFEIATLPGTPFLQYAGTIGNTQIDPYAESHPRWKSSTTLSYELGPVNTALTWRYVAAMSNAANVGNTGTTSGVGSRDYFDLDENWTIRRGLVLEAGIINLFDTEPPLLGGVPGNTDLSLYDVLGRRFYASLKAKF
jgi:outer membrane receptor protein involved in Fe transport